jgi:cytoskeletal protein CcmA (bactofilin family)
MFRKRKDNEGASGINRISRLIEQRQREAADEGDDDAMLDANDTILMQRTAPPASLDEDEGVSAVSLLGIRTPAQAEPAAPAQRQPEPADEPEDSYEPDVSPLGGSEPSQQVSAFAQQAYGAQTRQPWESEPEPEPEASYEMPVPNIGAATAKGTLVAADAEWEGKLIAQGDVRVEGVLRGEIQTTGTLVVAPQAQVHGIVRAREIVLGGDVEGEVSCEQRLEILPGGSARGQINSGTLVVHEGAYIDSRFQMRRADAGAS